MLILHRKYYIYNQYSTFILVLSQKSCISSFYIHLSIHFTSLAKKYILFLLYFYCVLCSFLKYFSTQARKSWLAQLQQAARWQANYFQCFDNPRMSKVFTKPPPVIPTLLLAGGGCSKHPLALRANLLAITTT